MYNYQLTTMSPGPGPGSDEPEAEHDDNLLLET